MRVYKQLNILTKLTAVFFFLLLFSCGTPKNITYFQGLKDLEEIAVKKAPAIQYQPKDFISIVVSASDSETAIPFNKVTITNSLSEENDNTPTSNKPMYAINDDGAIVFPVIGKLKVAGLSASEVKNLIEKRLQPYIKNATVSVQLENFKITVLGEVASPGIILSNHENITLLEAISMSGDLEIKGKRSNIVVIRQEDDKKVTHKIDLTSKELFNSPAYYLQQNDIVYVEPNKARKRESKDKEWSRILTSTSSILGIGISLILLLR